MWVKFLYSDFIELLKYSSQGGKMMGERLEKPRVSLDMERLFSVNPDLLCITDLEGKLRKLNKSWESILGYIIDEMIGKKFLDYIHPDDIEKSINALEDLGQGKQIIKFVNRYRCKDGSYRSIEWYAQPYEGFVYAAARDITDKIQKQIIIEEKEKNFRIFFETMDDLIFVATEQGIILHTNKAVSDKLGYSEDELKSMHILDVHPEICRKEAESIFSEMFKGLREYCNLPLKRKDGSFLAAETKVWFGEWNGQECIYGISKDLSNLQSALEKFHKLFDNNPALMAVSTTTDRKFIEVNNSFLQKLGYAREEIIGKSSSDLSLFVQSEIWAHLAEELEKNGKVTNIELEVRKKNGEILTGLFSGEVIRDQKEDMFLTIMVDVTEAKYIREELEVERKRLESIIEGTNAGTWEWNVQTGMMVFNERWAQIIGYAFDEISPLSAGKWKKYLYPDDVGKIDKLLKLHFNGESNYFECYYRMKHKNGQWIWVIDRGRISKRDREGKPLLMSGTHQDINVKIIEDYLENKTPEYFDLVDDNIGFFVDSTGFQLDVAKEIFEEYIRYLPGLFEDMGRSIEEGDFEGLAKLSHDLKGSSGNLRINSMYELAKELEKNALQHDMERSKRLFVYIQKLFH